MAFWTRKHNHDQGPQDRDVAHVPRRKKRYVVAEFVRSLKGKRPADQEGLSHKHGSGTQETDSMVDGKTSRITTLNAVPLRPNGSRKQSQTSEKHIVKGKEPSTSRTPSEIVVEEKKEKHIKVLQEEDLLALYSGAPHFGVREGISRTIPQVLFPWNKGQIQDLRDCPPPAHPAFSTATSRHHAPVLGRSGEDEKGRAGYDIGIEEVPCMLSATGFEPGTIGFEHFLGIPSSDNYIDPVEHKTGSGLSESARNLELLHQAPDKLGIRNIESPDVNERLVELSELYHTLQSKGSKATLLDEHNPGELYAILFGKLLHPPRFDPNASDPTGLKVQIEALLRVLKLRGVWFDFSLVEWRIRLGQLIWASGASSHAPSTSHLSDPDDEWGERETFLLQLTLACELLLRLDAVSTMSTPDVIQKVGLTAEEVESFSKLKSRKTDWDLLVARRFFEDVHVFLEEDTSPPAISPKKRGFFASITTSEPETPEPPKKSVLVFAPRHPTRQLSGLLHFATTLVWPNLDQISSDLSRKLGIPKPLEKEKAVNLVINTLAKTSPSVYGTPLATPRSVATNRTSYFPARPAFSRENTALSIQLRPSLVPTEAPGGPVDIGGWLSRAYLTGFILPGEVLPHLLISTILENDPSAIASLGDSANLYGAFIYAGSTWWSKSCVVGRVLAAANGAKECMGWIRSLALPSDTRLGERWLDISHKDIDVPDRLGRAVQDDGDLVKGKSAEASLAADFTLPVDEVLASIDSAPTVSLDSLELETTRQMRNSLDEVSIQQATGASPDEYEATEFGVALTFKIQQARLGDDDATSPIDPDINHDLDDHDVLPPTPAVAKHTVFITFDVHFISAFPCIAPSPSKVSVLLPNCTPPPSSIKGEVPAHPLHSSHAFRIVPVPTLLQYDTLLKDDVLVVQCRSADEQVLARAWCAQMAQHAIVSRTRRTCISCAVREAGACGVRVVIRIVTEE